jgi:hypothetical protein
MTGNYDNLVCHTYIDFDYDYVCFTDNKKLLKMTYYGPWFIKPLQFGDLDNTRNNRWHKLHPHVLFPAYEESIYVDSNVDIKSNYLFSLLEDGCKMTLRIPIHSKTNCVYKECRRVIKYRRDDKGNVFRTKCFLESEHFPINYGLTENGIVYRKHNDIILIKMMDMWWGLVKDYSKRDQLTLPYVLWRYNVSPYDIALPNALKDKAHFTFYNHREL